jgi:hypothetical protein
MKKYGLSCTGLVVTSLLVSGMAFAHHSFRTEFDSEQPIEVTGTVTKVEWMNPHARFYVDVEQEDGTVVNWDFELASPNILYRRGWRKDSVVPGDEVNVKAFRARHAEYVANTDTLTRLSDGKQVLSMSSPRE